MAPNLLVWSVGDGEGMGRACPSLGCLCSSVPPAGHLYPVTIWCPSHSDLRFPRPCEGCTWYLVSTPTWEVRQSHSVTAVHPSCDSPACGVSARMLRSSPAHLPLL